VAVLESLGVDLESVRIEVENQTTPSSDTLTIGDPQFTPSAKKVWSWPRRSPKNSGTITSAPSTCCSVSSRKGRGGGPGPRDPRRDL
jgi:hypothetical protein